MIINTTHWSSVGNSFLVSLKKVWTASQWTVQNFFQCKLCLFAEVSNRSHADKTIVSLSELAYYYKACHQLIENSIRKRSTLFRLGQFGIRDWGFRGKVWLIFSWVVFQLLITGCSGADTKLQQYKVHGEELYLTHCSNCHQADGKGLGLLFPPLDKSDFVDGNKEKVICLIEKGVDGEMTVNGQSFNKAMPAIPQLTDLEIAEIVTYLYNSWGREKGIVEVTEVTSIIQNCNP